MGQNEQETSSLRQLTLQRLSRFSTSLGRLLLGVLRCLWWLVSASWVFEIERWYVCKVLGERVEEVKGFAGKKMVDRDVLEWDFYVRALFRRYLGPHHLEKYVSSTALSAEDATDPTKSAEALKRGRDLIDAAIQAIRKRTGILTGGISHAWWFRAIADGFVTTLFGALATFVFLVVNSCVLGDGIDTAAVSEPKYGTEKEIFTESGEVVEEVAPLTPTSTPTPIFTPTPGPTPAITPSPTPVVSVPEGPPLDIPPEPEEDEPVSDAEKHFNDGVDALEREDFETAVMEFEAAVEIEPGFVRAYYNLALAHERLGTPEDVQAAVQNYTKAIDLWNSLGEDNGGLLFQAKLSRGLLLVDFATERADICLGRLDLLEFLERGDPSPRNEEAANKALAQIEVDCENTEEEPETR